MADIKKYVLVDKDGQEVSDYYDSFVEAKNAAGTECAVIEHTFVFDDSEIAWTPNGDDVWPPEEEE